MGIRIHHVLITSLGVLLQPTAIKARLLFHHDSSSSLNHNQIHQLCINLSSSEYGGYGKQTIEVTNDHSAEWLLEHDDIVSSGPCSDMYWEILNHRELKEVAYCILGDNGQDEYDIQAPRFLESFMVKKGAGRGECMTSNNSSDDASGNTVELCFDLDEYGMQTLSMEDGSSSSWFLNDPYVVTEGPCPSAGEELDEREMGMVTYCKQVGSLQDGHEVEIEAPRFFGDYLRDEKGAELGNCPGTNSRQVQYNHLPEYFVPTDTAMAGRSSLRPQTRSYNNNWTDGNLVNLPKAQSVTAYSATMNNNHDNVDNSSGDRFWEDGTMMCSCVQTKPAKGTTNNGMTVTNTNNGSGNTTGSKNNNKPSKRSKRTKRSQGKNNNKPNKRSKRSQKKDKDNNDMVVARPTPCPTPKNQLEQNKATKDSNSRSKKNTKPGFRSQNNNNRPNKKPRPSRSQNVSRPNGRPNNNRPNRPNKKPNKQQNESTPKPTRKPTRKPRPSRSKNNNNNNKLDITSEKLPKPRPNKPTKEEKEDSLDVTSSKIPPPKQPPQPGQPGQPPLPTHPPLPPLPDIPTHPPLPTLPNIDPCEQQEDDIGPLCDGWSDGTYLPVPGTDCSEFVHCYQGCIRYRHSCVAGLLFDVRINSCNWAYAASCGV